MLYIVQIIIFIDFFLATPTKSGNKFSVDRYILLSLVKILV